jgi:hypothetical protein
MNSPDPSRAAWRKSGRSDNNGGGACVQVADLGAQIAVRDSKNPEHGALLLARENWAAFIGDVRNDVFQRVSRERWRATRW